MKTFELKIVQVFKHVFQLDIEAETEEEAIELAEDVEVQVSYEDLDEMDSVIVPKGEDSNLECIDMTNTSELKRLLRENGYMAVLWGKHDIEGRAKDMGVELSEGQVANILDNLERTHDAELGINWDTIESAIESECAE